MTDHPPADVIADVPLLLHQVERHANGYYGTDAAYCMLHQRVADALAAQRAEIHAAYAAIRALVSGGDGEPHREIIERAMGAKS